MAIWDVVAGHESGIRVCERRQATARRIMLCDNYRNAEAEAPKLGDPYPDNENLTVGRVTIEGYGAPVEGSEPEYEMARITVEYTYPNLVADGTPLFSSQSNCQILEIGAGRKWASSGGDVGEEANITVAYHMRELCFHTLKSVPPSVDAYANCVNSGVWVEPITGLTYPAETVLFCGVSHLQQFDSQANGYLYNIEWRFMVNPLGWNVFWNGETGAWDTVLPTVYDSIDFMLLGM